MKNADAQKSSNMLKAFKIFLGNEMRPFCTICKNLSTYKIGIQKGYRLVDIRNGIAHGDVAVSEIIDESCYREISALLYKPPMQVLYEVINHTKRK